jgi:hypothetical protein
MIEEEEIYDWRRRNINDVISLPAPTWTRSKAMRLRNMYYVPSSNFKAGSQRTPRLKEKSFRLLVLLFILNVFQPLGARLQIKWYNLFLLPLNINNFLYKSNTCMHFPNSLIFSFEEVSSMNIGFNNFMIFLFNS